MKSTEALKQFSAYFNFRVKQRQVKNYASWLRQFFISLNNPEIESIHLGQVLTHLQLSRDFELDELTIYGKCLALRQFFKFFRLQQFRVLDPELIPAKKPQAKFVDFITEEEHQALLKVIRGKTDRAIRNTAILGLLHDTGMRKGELISLDMERVDLVKMEALIHTEKARGNVQVRPVFWTKETNEDLKKWLNVRSTYSDCKNFDSSAVFITLWRRKSGTRISDSSIEEFIRRGCVDANLRTLHAHLYRHAFGNKLGVEGVNNSTISGLMGHATINASQIYTALNDQQKRGVYTKHFRT